MSSTQIDQQGSASKLSSSSPSQQHRRSSLLVNLSSTSKRRLSSSIVRTTSSTSSSSGGGGGYHSINDKYSPPPMTKNSPVDDLRQRLSYGMNFDNYFDRNKTKSNNINRQNHIVRRECLIGGSTSSNESGGRCARGSTSPQSAPPSLLKPNYSGDVDANFTILTNADDRNNNNNNKTATNSLQVIEVYESPEQQQDNSATIEESSECSPKIEVKHTSSSSAGSSPASSDCEQRQQQNLGRSNKQIEQHHLTSSSSSRLIRRRTVRRSYHHHHHRATKENDQEEEQSVSSRREEDEQPSKVGETRDENQEEAEKDDQDEAKSTQQESSVENSQQSSGAGVNSFFRTRQIGSYSYGQAKQQQQQQQKSSFTTNNSSSRTSSSRQVVSSSTSSTAKSEQQQQQQTGKMAASTLEHYLSGANGRLFEREPAVANNAANEAALAEDVISRRSVEVEQEEESRVRHRESSFESLSSLRHHQHNRHHQDAGLQLRHHQEESSSSSMKRSEMASSLSRRAANGTTTTTSSSTLTGHHHQHFEASSTSSSSSSSTSAGTFRNQQQQNQFLNAPSSLFTSPGVHSLVQQIGTDFADLENKLSTTTNSLLYSANQSNLINSTTAPQHLSTASFPSLSTRLFGAPLRFSKRALSPNQDSLAIEASPAEIATNSSGQLNSCDQPSAANTLPLSLNGAKIRELLNKAQQHGGDSESSPARNVDSDKNGAQPDLSKLPETSGQQKEANNEDAGLRVDHCEAVKNEIERIDQRMSDLCRELEQCQTTEVAIDLLKIMIQMIEKAWSVPVCGDDLGFKLCNSLRHAGGLDIILGFINEAETSHDHHQSCSSSDNKDGMAPQTAVEAQQQQQQSSSSCLTRRQSARLGKTPLRLSLTKLNEQQNQEQLQMQQQQQQEASQKKPTATTTVNNGSQSATSIKDNDSDIFTSDLGLDSTSVESLSYVSAAAAQQTARASPETAADQAIQDVVQDRLEEMREESCVKSRSQEDEPSRSENFQVEEQDKRDIVDETNEKIENSTTTTAISEKANDEENLRKLNKEELVFLSARLLSQCLTSDNRDYIVTLNLDHIIRLACNYITVKSIQRRCKRLLSRTSSEANHHQHHRQQQQQQQQQQNSMKLHDSNCSETTRNEDDRTMKSHSTNDIDKRQQASGKEGQKEESAAGQQQQHDNKQKLLEESKKSMIEQQRLASDIHSAIGTEILQHLFKHSEETCSAMISLGALQAILFGCRSSNVETLRHCAMALANLALYGGSDSQQTMIEHKAHVWLFPLAFHEHDNVRYYACLAIVVLAANQEIEADVLKSGTLELVEPFVTSHEPRNFAESTTAHIHGQSAGWLRKLVPLLESKREEARNLACFHFAMEAHIKREQGQTKVFQEIGAVESLRRAGSLPIAIASKFACQALRLIGEREPHKLSQQVPLWTIDDVCVWVSQIGFDRFTPAFRDSHVDGDLLLQLHDEMLKFDIGIENGIIRKRFLRELSSLKRIADYSSVDRSSLSSLLASTSSLSSLTSPTATISHFQSSCNSSARDYLQYIYPILRMGVTRDNIHLLDSDQLLSECKITNTIHRIKLAQAIRELQERRVLAEAASSEQNSISGSEQKTLDCFVSYRRSTGSQLASLLKVHLQLRGFSVFIDVERLEAGKFDNNLLDSIKSAKNFILVLSQSALDRCIGDHQCKDWVHKEIVAALSSNCNIIPIMDTHNFQWPDAEQLPEDMRSIPSFNCVRWIHEYQDACVDKLERFIRGDWPNLFGVSQQQQQAQQQQQQQQQQQSSSGSIAGSINCLVASSQNSAQASQLQRFSGPNGTSTSTPSIVATPLLCGGVSSMSHNGGGHSQYQQAIRTCPPPHPSESDHHPLSFAANNGYLMNHLHQQQQHHHLTRR